MQESDPENTQKVRKPRSRGVRTARVTQETVDQLAHVRGIGKHFMPTHGDVPLNKRPQHPIQLAHVDENMRPDGYIDPRNSLIPNSEIERRRATAHGLESFQRALPRGDFYRDPAVAFSDMFLHMAHGQTMQNGGHPVNTRAMQTELAKSEKMSNAMAAEWRARARHYQTNAPGENGPHAGINPTRLLRDGIIPKSDYIDALVNSRMGNSEVAKSILDVGTNTNLGSVTGGQTLGYVSLDTRLARGTVRPDSFTFYQMLPKSAAFQPVDFWGYVDDPGGALPGSATSAFSSVQSGSLSPSAGIYELNSVTLKLMLDARAVTLALVAQNNYASINENENANAALTVLSTADWLNFHGNPAIFPNQYSGMTTMTPTTNIFDFGAFYNNNAALQGWSVPQALYNLIYEASAQITSWGRFGRITHALMTPITNGSLQGLVTTTLNNIVTELTPYHASHQGIVVDGDLQGMRTRMGPIQFPLDMMITARDIPAQGQPRSNGTTPTTATAPTPPSGVVLALSGAAYPGSNWGVNATFYSGSSKYYYAVASTDVNMNESNLTWSSGTVPGVPGFLAGSGITSSGAAIVSIGNPAANDAYAYRIYRTGAGGFGAVVPSPTAVRYVGSVLASSGGAGATITFVDYNGVIPGSEKIFLLDLRPEDNALDWRYMLPLTRVELFASNLYMPWAVCTIGAIRNRIPKFHGLLVNYVPDSPIWSPYTANA